MPGPETGAMLAPVPPPDIDAPRLTLRPIDAETARALLDGRAPAGIVLADDYPSEFSIEVMDLVAGPRAAEGVEQFGPFFVVRKSDGAAIGEIGAALNVADDRATAQIGYSLVPSSWGQGYATEALRALVDELLAGGQVRRVFGETMVDHPASRRVMEKAGMRESGRRRAEEAGRTVEVVVYEIVR
jgi:ribosomal-protein-alanine N-acetyltransferase